MEAMGRSCPQNKISAAPPNSTKIGAPRTAAASSVNRAGRTSVSGAIGGRGAVPHPPPLPFEKIHQGREREQAAFARRQRPAQQPNEQRQMLLKGGRAADAGLEQFAQDDFPQRQEHQGGQRERDQEIFALPQPAAPAVACRGGLGG